MSEFHKETDNKTLIVISLRDWFAGMAICGHTNSVKHGCKNEFAEEAYKLADAMLREREKHV